MLRLRSDWPYHEHGGDAICEGSSAYTRYAARAREEYRARRGVAPHTRRLSLRWLRCDNNWCDSTRPRVFVYEPRVQCD